jgi:hypothetical protein
MELFYLHQSEVGFCGRLNLEKIYCEFRSRKIINITEKMWK